MIISLEKRSNVVKYVVWNLNVDKYVKVWTPILSVTNEKRAPVDEISEIC